MATAQWVEAIGTSGALLIGALAYVQSLRDRRRDHASKVSAWVEPDGVVVSNTSDEPAYIVAVVGVWDVAVGQMIGDYPDDMRVLPGRTNKKVPLSPETVEYLEATSADWLVRVTIPVLRFVDRAGRHWERDTWGRVRQIGRLPPKSWLGINLGKRRREG